ncbi:MAG: aldo/keto reductase [Halobacteriales archaeon]
METRALGDTGQESTVLTFGAIILDRLEQPAANRAVELAMNHGVNHIDVAPAYGDAELKLGPKLREYREDVFLGCKTGERDYEGARRKLDRSLDRLGVETIDLYQFHGLETEEELETIVGGDGALKAFREAKDEGTVEHIGLTSHGRPDLILGAIDRIDDLESVMFPMNYTVMGKDDGEHDYAAVLERLNEEGMGAIGIKAFAKQPWPDESDLRPDQRAYGTWYEPYDTQEEIDDCLNFALSQGMDTITNAGDPKLLPMILDAAERFETLSAEERADLRERGRRQESPVPARLGDD